MTALPDGLLLLDKPAGPTSHDVVSRLRRATRTRRIGHTGTLDPPATGLLALVLGRATRLARYLPDAPKVYVGSLRLGTTTSTDDATGEVVSRHEGPLPDPEIVLAASRTFRGPIRQRPPRVSARRVDGQRLYALARRGVEVDLASVEVVVERFDLTPTSDLSLYEFEAAVSSGTYIRSLARDLGDRLGCGGAVASLRRVSIGPLRVGDAIGLDEALAAPARIAGRVLPLAAMPLAIPDARLAGAVEVARFRAGRPARCAPGAPADGAVVAVRDPAGAIVGVGSIEEGLVRPRAVLSPEAGLPRPDPL